MLPSIASGPSTTTASTAGATAGSGGTVGRRSVVSRRERDRDGSEEIVAGGSGRKAIDVHVEAGEENDASMTITTADVNATNTAYMWSLLLSTLAECLMTCFLPDWYLPGYKVNVTATAINFVGPFLDGMSFGYEEIQERTHASPVPCLQFRAAFLGVFTSYSFMVDHAGDLSASSIFAGPTYIIGSILGACGCFHLGKRLVKAPTSAQALHHLVNSKSIRHLPSFLLTANVFIITTVLRAMFGQPGFVRDPKDPQFIGPIRVDDGEELILGIFMSATGILISDFLEDRFSPRPDRDGMVSVIDWGNLVCNFLSCWLTCLAYEASKLAPVAFRNSLLVMKFVACFCGSVSNFSGAINHIMILWHAGNRAGAVWNVGLQVATGLLFLPYLLKPEVANVVPPT